MKQIAVVDEKECRACGCCVRSCKSKQIALGRTKADILPGCVGCGSCVKACPFDAIRLTDAPNQ